MNTKENRRADLAFVRTDLIALLAAIAVLSLLLLPARGEGRLRSRLVECMNNQKQLAAAWRAFADDRAGTIVGPGDANQFDWRVRPGQSYFNANPPPPNPVPQNAHDAVKKYDSWGYQIGGLYPYAPDTTLINCPDDYRFRKLSQPAYVSYSGLGGYARGITQFQINNVGQILHPDSRFVFVEEADSRSMTYTWWTFQENLGSWTLSSSSALPDPSLGETYGITTFFDGPAAFHGDGAMFTYADGHVAYRRWMDSHTIKFALSPVWGRQQGSSLTLTNDLKFIVRGYANRKNP